MTAKPRQGTRFGVVATVSLRLRVGSEGRQCRSGLRAYGQRWRGPETDPTARPDLLTVARELAAALEAYCDDHNSDRPTDPTVLLPDLLAAIKDAEEN